MKPETILAILCIFGALSFFLFNVALFSFLLSGKISRGMSEGLDKDDYENV